MSSLIRHPAYQGRDDAAFLREMNELTRHHVMGCEAYARLFARLGPASSVDELPFLHVGLFKRLNLVTHSDKIIHERTLQSSSTGGVGSRIALDKYSSDLQARSSRLLLEDFIGSDKRPLIILDSVRSLQKRGEISARVAAALSLRPLASEIFFALDDPDDMQSLKIPALLDLCSRNSAFYAYGFSWILWRGWAENPGMEPVREALRGKPVTFIHSGGWKKLESEQVERPVFEAKLLGGLDPASKVVDYYGLVEQVGVIYPMCNYGYRHVPIWADILVRDPFSLASMTGKPGLLQLMNLTAWGAPYHNCLTEDLGQIEPGSCPCGREGKRFSLLGRLPKAEVRGCANV